MGRLTRPSSMALAILLVSATLLLPGCSGPQPGDAGAGAGAGTATAADRGEPVAGGRLVVGTAFDVEVWNEYLARRDTTYHWVRRLYLPLAVQTDPSRLTPDAFEFQLAESVERSEDGKLLTFTLRDTTWSDGTPVTADDVVFTWQAQTSEDLAWISASGKERIMDVRADPADPRRVTFEFVEAYPFQLADAVEGGILPAHVLRDVPLETWRDRDWSVEPVVSGPFQVASHAPGDRFVLRRNERYWREGRPYLDEIVVKIVSEPTAMLAQLNSGELDLLVKLSPRDADRLRGSDDVSLISYPYADIQLIGWNGSRPPFDDARVRRAMTLGIDREGLIDRFAFGEAAPTATIVASFTAGANRRLQPLPFDPDEARRLLRQAGYGESNPLSFSLVTNSGNPLRRDLVTAVQAQLAEIGVDVEVSVVDPGEVGRQIFAGEYDAFLRGLVLTGNPDLGLVFGSQGDFNVVGYRSDEVDNWLSRLGELEGWDGMKDAMDRIQRQVHDDQPFTFLFEGRGLVAHGESVAGFEVDVPNDPLVRLDESWRSGA